jgi:hypothetical protein
VATQRKTVVQSRASAEALGHGPADRHTLLHSLAGGAGPSHALARAAVRWIAAAAPRRR